MKLDFLLTGLFLATSVESALIARAGGPIPEPIPKDCTVTNPLPGSSGFKLTNSFNKANLLYSSYYPSTGNPKREAKTCAEQCYGFGNPGECKSSFFALYVPVPKNYYGGSGGQLLAACLLYSVDLESSDFVAAKAGEYQSESASVISCPSS